MHVAVLDQQPRRLDGEQALVGCVMNLTIADGHVAAGLVALMVDRRDLHAVAGAVDDLETVDDDPDHAIRREAQSL